MKLCFFSLVHSAWQNHAFFHILISGVPLNPHYVVICFPRFNIAEPPSSRSASDAPHRSPWCKFSWYSHWNDQECPPGVPRPSAGYNMSARTNAADCVETLSFPILSPCGIISSFPSRYSIGPWVFRSWFGRQDRFLFWPPSNIASKAYKGRTAETPCDASPCIESRLGRG